jgi:hypothetical protein
MPNEDVAILRFEDFRKTTNRPADVPATEADASVLSFADRFQRSAKASLRWVSDCPPLATLQKPEGESTSRVDYTGSFFQALREVDMFRRQTRGLGDITPDAEMRRAVHDLPIDELFIQLKEGGDNWQEHPELYAAIANEICRQVESADLTAPPPPRLQLFSGNGAVDVDDQVEERLSAELQNYLT